MEGVQGPQEGTLPPAMGRAPVQHLHSPTPAPGSPAPADTPTLPLLTGLHPPNHHKLSFELWSLPAAMPKQAGFAPWDRSALRFDEYLIKK